MRVLHVAEILKGGMASYLDEVLSFQSSALGPDRLSAIVPRSQSESLTSGHLLKLHPFEDSDRRLKNFFILFSLVREVAKAECPDVIHAHSSFAGAACRIAFAFKHKPPAIVYCSHGWAFDRESSKFKNTVLALIERGLSWLTNKIICISEHDFKSGQRAGIPAKKMVTILNGIADLHVERSAENISWPEPEKLRVLFVGRFDRQKGVDVFFSALSQLQDECTAYAIGDAALGDAPVAPPPPNVRLTGWLPRATVQRYLQSCDVFVMPSRWEGFGLSALEAMRAGKMVIASEVGGLVELIAHGHSGFLVPPNQVDALAKAIKNTHKGMVEQFGRVARQRFLQMFTARQMNHSILKTYTEVSGKIIDRLSPQEFECDKM